MRLSHSSGGNRDYSAPACPRRAAERDSSSIEDQSSDRGRALSELEERETHLRNTFRTLGIASRVEVARVAERAHRAP